jgi:serine/threonine protein kinase
MNSEHDMAQLVDEHYHKYQASPFRPEQIKTLLQQLLSAMDHVHAHCSLIHRDVKLSNLLYNESCIHGGGGCCLKLCDFGLARTYSSDYYYHSLAIGNATNDSNNNHHPQPSSRPLRLLTPNVVSLWYRAPELLLGAGSSYTQAIDMWAVGCVFAEFVLGRPLLNGKTELQQVEQIFDVIGVPPATTAAAAVSTTSSVFTKATPRMAATNGAQLSQHFNLMDLPLIRNGKVQVPRKSRRRLLTLLGDVLSPAGMKIMTQLLHLNHVQRWTALEALTLTTYFTTELPQATRAAKMPRFSV